MQWNPSRTSSKLAVDTDGITIFAKAGGGFKSTIGNVAFREGCRYFFQIEVVAGNPKIGVCRGTANIDRVYFLMLIRKQAFSDGDDGWGIYNGELRHKSNSTGTKYGKNLQAGDIVGVMLDMIDVCRRAHALGHAFICD